MEFENKILGNIELYYSPASFRKGGEFKVCGEETKHILKVMRHTAGDELYITDGQGTICKTNIESIEKDCVTTRIVDEYKYVNNLKNIFFCVTRLKSSDRFEIALEKCTELGITNFIVYNSERAVPKGNKAERWEKILISAMKQSLRSFIPELSFINSLKDLDSRNGKKFLLSQESENTFSRSLINNDYDYYFIFGPEGDLTMDEQNYLSGVEFYNLGNYRLRSETAVIKCASLL